MKYIALCLVIFLVFQGEASMLKKNKKAAAFKAHFSAEAKEQQYGYGGYGSYGSSPYSSYGSYNSYSSYSSYGHGSSSYSPYSSYGSSPYSSYSSYSSYGYGSSSYSPYSSYGSGSSSYSPYSSYGYGSSSYSSYNPYSSSPYSSYSYSSYPYSYNSYGSASGQEEAQTSLSRLGELQFSITWDQSGDADIIVKTPSGKVISYANRGPNENTDFGQLEQDRTGHGPESVYWTSNAPAGNYYVCVRTGSFQLSESNPLTVTATLFTPGEQRSMIRRINETVHSLDCDPSAAHFIGEVHWRGLEEGEQNAQPEISEIPDVPRLGSLQFTIMWSREGDGDLIVKTPSGKVIYYGNRGPNESTDSGQLEQDRSGYGPENIYWEGSNAPAGTYHICLRTGSFSISRSDPLIAMLLIFDGDRDVESQTKVFYGSHYTIECEPGAPNYVRSYTHRGN